MRRRDRNFWTWVKPGPEISDWAQVGLGMSRILTLERKGEVVKDNKRNHIRHIKVG